MQEMELILRDGHRLFYRVWEVESPKATVHINHGMAEHSLRYSDFAEYLNTLGFSVYAQDHRGHGYTAEEDERGWFAETDGALTVVEDSYELDVKILNENPGIPHFVFGHSMGSFITRCAITLHPIYNAAVICGTGADQGIVGKVGRMIARHHVKKWGSRMQDADLDKLAFGSFNRKFPDEGDFAWLSRDRKQVEKYIADPLCGFVCSSGFYADLVDLISMANDRERADRIQKDMPMFIISGAMDPVGGFGKGIEKVEAFYRKVGIRELEMKLYPDCRHEILNELDNRKVYGDVGDFFTRCLEIR